MKIDNVPFIDLGRQFRSNEKAYSEIFQRVGRSGAYIMGESLVKFETEIASYCDVRHALGVANGTDALILILRALGIGQGDEVITATNSYIASAGSIAAVKAKPVFADVLNDLNLDPDSVAKQITPKTKAIMAVHLTGRPSDIDKLNEIIKGNDIVVIEDSAQAIGATYHGKKVGSLGIAASFSLHPLKNLNVIGDGGFISTNDTNLYEKIKLLRNHGLIDRDTCMEWGLNSRLDSLQAEIALYNLARIDDWNVRLRQIAARYRDGLSDVVTTPKDKDHEYAVYHNFVVYADNREELMSYLLEHGVETKIHYPILLHLQPASRDLNCKEGDFPMAEKLSKQMLSLPIYPDLRNSEVDYVINMIREFYNY